MCNLLCKIRFPIYKKSLVPFMHDYQKLSNHPLVLALAEFRFSAVLDIERFIPKIQEELRLSFPLLNEMSNQEIQINPNGIEVRQNKEWAFISKDKHSAIMLNQNRLVFLTSNYDRFDGFQHSCQLGLDAVANIVSPSLLLRIGLRYTDKIAEKENEIIEEYVHSSVCRTSHLHNIGSTIRQTIENFIKTNEGYMVVRSMFGINNLTLWPDLNNLPITIKEDINPTKKILLDFDHFWEPEEDEVNVQSFETKNILAKLDKMHLHSRRVFWDMTTEKGRKVWK